MSDPTDCTAVLQNENSAYRARLATAENRIASLEAEVAKYKKDAERLGGLYQDLLYQVIHVVPGETRHESARRIIDQHENQSHGPAAIDAELAKASGEGK